MDEIGKARKGTCILCYRPTKTALGLAGSLEWVAAGLVRLGVPQKEAIAFIKKFGNNNAENAFRVCSSCVKKSGSRFKVGPEHAIPMYYEPPHLGGEEYLRGS
jgi:hypothetical protein